MSGSVSGRILSHRQKNGETQDQFGRRYGVSGPAIFKFEKGFINPKLSLWLSITKDMSMDPRRAVNMWVKNGLPEQYQNALCPPPSAMLEENRFSGIHNSANLSKTIVADKSVPHALVEFAQSDEWALYSPTGEEIDLLLHLFGDMADGSVRTICEAIRLVRNF